jgi:hypothetical protein
VNKSIVRSGHWIPHRLSAICDRITDGKHGDCTNQFGSKFYFLSAKDVLDGHLVYDDARQITELDFRDTHRRTRLEPGNTVITNSGTIGRMAYVRDTENTYIHVSHNISAERCDPETQFRGHRASLSLLFIIEREPASDRIRRRYGSEESSITRHA